MRIPLGFAVLAEPVIVPAVIVEGLAGLGLAVSAYALFARRTWAWAASVAAHVFALCGVLLGVFAIAMSRGPSTDLNDTYHRLMLLVLAAGPALLATSTARAALGLAHRPSPPE